MNQYQQQYQQTYLQNNEVVSVGEWIITYLIMCIPCLGLIMMCVWAFGNNTKKSKSNFCKAMLLISLVCMILAFICFFMAGMSAAILS